MIIQQAVTLYQQGKIDQVELRRNPANAMEWFIMVRKNNGKYLMLADEHDAPLVDKSIENLFELLKSIGFKEARVVF